MSVQVSLNGNLVAYNILIGYAMGESKCKGVVHTSIDCVNKNYTIIFLSQD